MVNSIKESADGLALQVTREARKAGLVQEDADGNPTGLSDVTVWGFDDLLLVIGDYVAMGHRADLVSTAAGDTGSVHAGRSSTLAVAGNGYQVQLPGCQAAGFTKGDDGHVRAGDGVLFIHDGRQGRLIDDLFAIRDEQVSR
jgi:hypothetical protein